MTSSDLGRRAASLRQLRLTHSLLNEFRVTMTDLGRRAASLRQLRLVLVVLLELLRHRATAGELLFAVACVCSCLFARLWESAMKLL